MFDLEFLEHYEEFMKLCFRMFRGWGNDATLRTHADQRRQAAGSNWNPAWDACFADRGDVTKPPEIRKAYVALVEYFAQSMGAAEVNAHAGLDAGRLPINVVPPTSGVHPDRSGEKSRAANQAQP